MLKWMERVFLAPDEGLNPQMKVEPEKKEDTEITKPSEEIVYVDSEDELKKLTGEADKKDEKPSSDVPEVSIADLIAKQNEGFKDVLSNLGDVIAKKSDVVTQTPVQQQGKVETDEEFKARYAKLLFDDPVKARQEYDLRYLAPIVGQQQALISNLQKQVVLQNEKEKDFLDKYGKEVDGIYQQMNDFERAKPDAYKKAVNQVKLDHLDDLIQAKAATMAKELSDGRHDATIEGIPRKSTFSSAGGVQQASAKTGGGLNRKYVVVPKYIREYAEKRGEDPETTYRLMKERGELDG